MTVTSVFVYTAPETYSDLVGLLSGHHDIDQVIIVERLRACHHPSLAEGNKDKLEKLFTLLLQVGTLNFTFTLNRQLVINIKE